MTHSCKPFDKNHDASESAAVVAADLLGYAQQVVNPDNVFTEFSAQYLLDNACPKKVDGKDRRCCNLTVKDCVRFALKEGVPRADQWVHLGSLIKPAPSVYKPALVTFKGELLQPTDVFEALKLLKHQLIGARMHVFNPDIDHLIDNSLGPRPSGVSRYVGLRDVIICGVQEVDGINVANVKIYYKKKFWFIKVSLDVFIPIPKIGRLANSKPASKPVRLFVDFCVPKLSID